MLQVELEKILTEDQAIQNIHNIITDIEDNNEVYVINKEGVPAVAFVNVSRLKNTPAEGISVDPVSKNIQTSADTVTEPLSAFSPTNPTQNQPIEPVVGPVSAVYSTLPEMPPLEDSSPIIVSVPAPIAPPNPFKNINPVASNTYPTPRPAIVDSPWSEGLRDEEVSPSQIPAIPERQPVIQSQPVDPASFPATNPSNPFSQPLEHQEPVASAPANPPLQPSQPPVHSFQNTQNNDTIIESNDPSNNSPLA